ncbi:O-mycaminosyltylonolide 6-deoxyallosyltransferase [Prauserella rugosa]|uniref:O-mycaminosyltylonolide 6-deoxyallosyltransferase n=2 Tax=Prauserella rugosa TaxID=43354 RepID=A0A660CAY6_9PSEU|nr:O-mycaminosyltylonolide 6-deoxyallosyltransferase [Prauserella rugosa]
MAVVGSRGDVQPFLALGSAMRERGHEVRLATHADFRELTAEAGLEFHPVPGSPRHYFESPEVIESLRYRSPATRLLRSLRRPPNADAKAAAAGLAQLQSRLSSAYEGADLVVGSSFNRNIFLAAEPETPWAMVSWYPSTPTSAFPAMGAPSLPLGGWYNRLTHRISRAMEWRMTRPIVNAYRDDLGLRPLGTGTPFAELERRGAFLYLQSPDVLPAPADWPRGHMLAGYWYWDRPDWTPGPELVEAVERKPEPIVLSFGSLWPAYPPGSLHMVADAVRRTGHRLIVVDGPSQEELPDDVLRIHDADYSWLFPRAATVIHHGGFGTGSAVLRAGVPQVVVPIFVDHPFWAARMAALGVAPAPIPAPRLSTTRVHDALIRTLGDHRIRDRARWIGPRIEAERGLDEACALLESWVGDRAGNGTWAR